MSLMRAHRRAVRGRPPWLLTSCTAATACGSALSGQHMTPPKTLHTGQRRAWRAPPVVRLFVMKPSGPR